LHTITLFTSIIPELTSHNIPHYTTASTPSIHTDLETSAMLHFNKHSSAETTKAEGLHDTPGIDKEAVLITPADSPGKPSPHVELKTV
jgi:hypothetical protein